MIKNKWIGAITVLLMSSAVLAICFLYLNPSALSSLKGHSEPAYVSTMKKNDIIDVQIIADHTDWSNMLENATAEEYIPATIIINGDIIENAGIRPKGNSSLSMVAQDNTTDRYSFKIEFDHYIKAQTWQGLDKLALNNMQGDSSYMKEFLSYDIMNYSGVETPLFSYSNISVNGELWGFYLAIECLEESYAARVYGNDYGKLYKPESMGLRGEGRMNDFLGVVQNNDPPQSIPETPSQNSGRFPNRDSQGFPDTFDGNFDGFGAFGGGGMSSNGVSLQYTDDDISSYTAIFDTSVFKTTDTDYKRLIEALKKLADGEDLENIVDVEATLRYFAAHTVVVNLDSYISSMGHNYYLYEDNGQLTILPWDYNLSFGGFQSANASSIVNFPIDTPVSGVSMEDRPLIGKLLEVPEYLELYHVFLRQIVDGYFNSGLFEQTVDSLYMLISPYVENDPSAFYDYSDFQLAVPELIKLGLLRSESIQGQLDGIIPSTNDGQNSNSISLIDSSSVNLSLLGNMGGGMGGNMENRGNRAESEFAAGMAAPRPDNMRNGMNGFSPNTIQDPTGNNSARAPGFAPNQASSAFSEFDSYTWIFSGIYIFLLFAGLAFAALFKRRRFM